MRAIRRLFRRRPDPDRDRLEAASELYAAAVARGKVACRSCGERPGVRIYPVSPDAEAGRRLGAAPGKTLVGFFALCGECAARPGADDAARRAILAGEPAPGGAPGFTVDNDDDLRRLAAT